MLALQEEYGLGPIGLEGYDACLFHVPLATRLLAPMFRQEAWIHRIQAARIRAAANDEHQEQLAFWNFHVLLQRLRPPEVLQPEDPE